MSIRNDNPHISLGIISAWPRLSLVVLFILLYLLPLGQRPLFAPDEMRYAEVPREMIASGDWAVPHLNGLRYFEKPVLGYWLTGISMMVFGENAFAVRLPSALAAGVTALLIYLLTRGINKKDNRAGALAALIYLTCFEVVGVGTFAVLDTMLTLFLTGAMYFFFRALTVPSPSRRQYLPAAAAGVCCGLAFLTKGFLAFLVPALALGGFFLWQKRGRELVRFALVPTLAALLIALPWSLVIAKREPDFWSFFFWNEHIRRFLAATAQHQEPFWFFLAAAPFMTLPWSFAVPAALSGLRVNSKESSNHCVLIRFCLCWLLLPLLFFSACKGKLLTYILPCFPPFAILLAHGLAYNSLKYNCRRFFCGAAGAAILFGVVFTGFLGVQLTGSAAFRPYAHGGSWFLVANALVAMVMLFTIAASHRTRLRHYFFGLAPVPLLLSLNFAVPDHLLAVKAPGQLLARHRTEISPQTLVISDDDPIRAVCWEFKRRDVYLLERTGELDFGIHKENNGNRLLDLAQARKLINADRGQVILIASRENYDQWEKSLPLPTMVDDNGTGGYVLAHY